MSNVPAHLPGDLGEHDPRREAHPHGNEPGSGGHEVRLNSAETKGLRRDSNDRGATAAEHSNNNDPRSDNTAEHAFDGGSVENMDRQKRQQAEYIPGGRTGDDGVDDHLTRGGVQQRDNDYDSGLNRHRGSDLSGSGLTGGRTEYESVPVSGARSTGIGGAPYETGTLGSSGFSGTDPQERHQMHHGTAHHDHDFSHNHNTRTGALLDPASGRDTGIPGYAGGASGLTGSSHTGTGLVAEGERALHSGTHGTHGQTGYGEPGYGSSGAGLTGSGLTGSHTGTGLTGSHTGTGLTGETGYGSTGAGLTGTGLTGSHTGSTGERLREGVREGEYGREGYGQTGSTGERLREDLREGEYREGEGRHGSGLTGSHTGRHESTGERLKEGAREHEHEREREHGTEHGAEHKKPSLMDKLNPMKDADGDGKKGFMK